MEYPNKEDAAYLYLSVCDFLEPREKEKMLSLFDAGSIFEHFEDCCAKILPFERLKSIKSLKERREELLSVLERMEKRGYFALTRNSPQYPRLLAQIPGAPLVLFGEGNRELLKERIFSVVGSRRTPAATEAFGSKLCEELSEYFVIATGLAEGGDLAALKGALKSGRAISVLPCGIEECYPAAHISIKRQVAREGLLLSESLDEKTRKFSFHFRNRILAGLSEGTLVLSAGEKSGALITANYCLDYGRELFALPYSVSIAQGAGCNKLLKQGAYLCTETEDILSVFGIFMKEKTALPPLSDEEKEIIAALADGEEQHASVIARRAEMQIFEVTALLAELEMKGIIVKSGGNCYKLIG